MMLPISDIFSIAQEKTSVNSISQDLQCLHKLGLSVYTTAFYRSVPPCTDTKYLYKFNRVRTQKIIASIFGLQHFSIIQRGNLLSSPYFEAKKQRTDAVSISSLLLLM
jgi:hypothetical protein